MRRLLGVEVPSDALGCLQDVHWGAGSFGYFPSYALGCLIAAQLWEAIEARDRARARRICAAARSRRSRRWLAEHVHRHGRRLDTLPLVERATGQALARRAVPALRRAAGRALSAPSQPPLLAFLQHRQHVAGRVLEPADVRAAAAHDPALVLLEAVVALELHAARGELVDGRLDVVDAGS